jgi:DNA helicase-2/ATP-dependent DNA helicase PcrA
MPSLQEKLEKLNAAQWAAVNTIDGPVMVIAGPGTGKTEILSLRIGMIILKDHAKAKDILCLTYTDAAASEMRHRLIEYIGPDAYSIQVNTFHSFCNLVIQENPVLFQQARDLDSISDIDKFRLLQKLIDRFDDDHPLKKFKGQTYSSWDRLLELFSTMKRENWTPQHVFDLIDQYIERMRESEEFIYKRKSGEFNKGDFKEKDFKEKVVDKMTTLKAAVTEFDTYNALLAEGGRYDYDDMLQWVVDAFNNHPNVLANYQERFLYILVDEFQDTNGVQINILQKLIDHEWLDRPNVFVVGDDDQAIFRFQGANISNLYNFYKRYDPAVVLLEQNYRSSQKILNAAQRVIAPVATSLSQLIFKESKNLIASGQFAEHPQHACIHSYPNAAFENADIFHQLTRWHRNETPGSVAVLYTKHNLGLDIAYALKGAGIPFQTRKSADALQQPIIMHLLDILNCLSMLTEGANNDDGLLYRVLHLKYLKANASDLQRLILAYTAKSRDDKSTLFMWMGDPEKLDAITFQNRKKIDELFELINEATANYHTMPLIALVEWMVHRFGIMHWILQQGEKFTLLYTVKSFYDFVDQQSMGNRRFTAHDLIDICNTMSEYGISLPVQELASHPTGIHLSSLHGAKGLEYDTVFIKNFTENEWEKKRANNRQFSFPDNLIPSQHQVSELEAGHDVQDHDRRRLIYVGMTRAKQELFMTYPRMRDDGKLLTPSKYLTEIAEDDTCIAQANIESNEAILADYLVARMSGQNAVNLDMDHQEIKNRTANFVLNVSALNQYLECPLKFFYEKILLIPAAQKSYLIFGSALHDALKKFFDRRFDLKQADTGLEYLLWSFERFMDHEQHRFTESEFEDQITYGKRVLTQFYNTYVPKWTDDISFFTEHRVRDIHIDGVPVTGFIDRIDKINGDLRVYDYKTGRTESFYAKLKGPDEDNPEGGPYWRQMVFYDLLLERDPRFKQRMSAGYIQALEPKDDKFVQREVTITDEDRQFVSQLIQDVYGKIQRQEFDKYCGECEWCKMNDLQVPIEREMEE